MFAQNGEDSLPIDDALATGIDMPLKSLRIRHQKRIFEMCQVSVGRNAPRRRLTRGAEGRD